MGISHCETKQGAWQGRRKSKLVIFLQSTQTLQGQIQGDLAEGSQSLISNRSWKNLQKEFHLLSWVEKGMLSALPSPALSSSHLLKFQTFSSESNNTVLHSSPYISSLLNSAGSICPSPAHMFQVTIPAYPEINFPTAFLLQYHLQVRTITPGLLLTYPRQ